MLYRDHASSKHRKNDNIYEFKEIQNRGHASSRHIETSKEAKKVALKFQIQIKANRQMTECRLFTI